MRLGVVAGEYARPVFGTRTRLTIVWRFSQRVSVVTASAELAVASGRVVLTNTLTLNYEKFYYSTTMNFDQELGTHDFS